MLQSNSNSFEKRLSADLVDRIQRRWGVVYRGAENLQRSMPEANPGLIQPIETPTTVAPAVNPNVAPEVAGGVINMAAYQEQREATAEERRLAEIRQRVDQEAA